MKHDMEVYLEPANQIETHEKQVQALCKLIRSRVKDPNLFGTVIERVARRVCEGKIPLQDINDILSCIDHGGATIKNRGAYFVSGAKRLHRYHEVAWN